jgi:hypothetical protein
MPQAHYDGQTRRMPTPRRMSNPDAWYKAAKKVLPELPPIEEAQFIEATLRCVVWRTQGHTLVIWR